MRNELRLKLRSQMKMVPERDLCGESDGNNVPVYTWYEEVF